MEAEATQPPLLLDDGSPELSVAAFGRFEQGRVLVGVGDSAEEISQIEGNGKALGPLPGEYLWKDAAMNLTYQLFTSEGLLGGSGTLLAWRKSDQDSRFYLDQAYEFAGLGRGPYDGGIIKVGGVEWAIVQQEGNLVISHSTTDLPFQLFDDDAETYPYDDPYAVSRDLVQEPPNADSAFTNVLAHAYIWPRYDLASGPKAAPFNRNVDSLNAVGELRPQLRAGRDALASSAPYWGYVQGAFQDAELLDGDPGAAENIALGANLGADGAIIFSEALLDLAQGVGQSQAYCSSKTLAHEVGHQCGLLDNTGGIMNQGCVNQRYFVAPSIQRIRERTQ